MTSNIHCRLYGIAQTTPPGLKYCDIADEKRICIFDHLVRVHTESGNKTSKKCTHGPTDSQPLDKRRPIAPECLIQLGYSRLNIVHIVISANILPAMIENDSHYTIQLAIAMDSVMGHL